MTKKTEYVYKSYFEYSLRIITGVLIFGSLFFWDKNLFMSFWMRRFLLFLAGLGSLILLLKYHKDALKEFVTNKPIIFLIIFSTITLYANSLPINALLGNPIVHPSLMSLYSCILIGLFLSQVDKKQILKYTFYSINIWAVVNFIYWLIETNGKMRLGFLDTQVIYAACLFGIGIIIGFWHYAQKTINRNILIISNSFLLLCLILSQTRSAILITALVLVVSYYDRFLRKKHILLPLITVIFISIILVGGYFSRLSSTSYFNESINYRLDLVRASIEPDITKILFGGGIKSIENNINDNAYKYPEIKKDVDRKIVFESSHNYLVDLLVERGIVVLLLFSYIVYSALKVKNNSINKIFKSILLFIFIYLIFNNINLQMELILWVCILCLLIKNSHTKQLIT